MPSNQASLSLASAQDKHRLASGNPWLLLVDFNWQGQHVRVVRNPDSVTFDAGDGAGSQSYQPLAFEIDSIPSKSDGSLPQFNLKLSNVGRLAEGAIVQYQGAAGATVSIYVLNAAEPAGEPDLAVVATIVRTTTDSQWVTFTLGAPSPLRLLFPKRLYYQGTCMWQYKSAQCGYTGPLPTCSLTWEGPNGCLAHGNQVRFGGFPGIGSNGLVVANQV